MRELDSPEIMPTCIRITSIFRKAILSSEFKEREELSLTDIANNLSVSKTPACGALQILSSENLILLRMNKGTIVKGIATKTICEHSEVRPLLEGEAAVRTTLRRSDVPKLVESQVYIESLREDFTGDEYQPCNQNPHTFIWKAADNSKIYSALPSLWSGSSFGKAASAKDHQILSIRGHGGILGYIQSYSPYLMQKEMEHHIERNMNNIIGSFSSKEDK